MSENRCCEPGLYCVKQVERGRYSQAIGSTNMKETQQEDAEPAEEPYTYRFSIDGDLY